jgi:D-amino-acid oxidase
MRSSPQVTIIGCGVIGLSCGLVCQERGWVTGIVARDLPPHTVSNQAGAVWFPFKAGPRDLVGKWSAAAYEVFSNLVPDPASGVQLTTLFDLHGQVVPAHPWWASSLPPGCLRQAGPEELPPGYVDGYALRVPLIEPDKYLNFLMDRFLSRGGAIRQQEVHSLNDLDHPLLVNCSGLGARELAQDPEVFPISGHIALAKAKRPVRCLMDDQGKNALAYVFPRPDVCVLGGTSVENDWSEDPDPATIQAIVARCREMEPGLADARVIGSYVGLRPGRRVIRFEKELLGADRFIFHNYGHGGSGFTVSWGCARELAEILVAVMNTLRI